MTILQLIWLFLPAALANMAPVLFKWVPFLNYPIDGGFKLNGSFLFGPHKTYRGIMAGVVTAIAGVYIQSFFTAAYDSGLAIIIVGILLGGGALLGDLIKSFFKRRVGIEAGQPWLPFDQVDWIIGAVLAIQLVIPLSWRDALLAIVVAGALHPLTNYVGYSLGIQKNKL